MITMIVVALHHLVPTVQEATENAHLGGLGRLHMTSTTIEVTREDRLLLASRIHPHQEDMKNHTIAGLRLLPLEGTILTHVEIHTLDLEVLHLLEAMAVMVAVVVATVVMTIDDIR